MLLVELLLQFSDQAALDLLDKLPDSVRPERQTLALEILVEHRPVCHENNMLLVELLLQFSDQAALDFLDKLPDSVWEVHDQGRPVLDLNILCTCNNNVSHIGLDVTLGGNL